MISDTIRCAECGNELVLDAGVFVSQCSQCGERNLVLIDDRVMVFEMETALEAGEAVDVAAVKLAGESGMDFR
ncbi:hypothetical protein JXA80_09755, partial [bacterium]|nr:hypothetical protein [candidate division CSSED10-310 bacterium]